MLKKCLTNFKNLNIMKASRRKDQLIGRKKVRQDILKQLTEGQLNPKQAYRLLYPNQRQLKCRKAHFVKLRIKIPEEKGVTRFLAFLFLLPFPLFLVRWGLKFVKEDQMKESPLSKKDILHLIGYKPIRLQVRADDGVIVNIHTL